MNRSRQLRLEQLETRATPAQFGIPWSNHNLTLSFVPDGTLIDGQPSRLADLMSGSAPSVSAWKSEVLRAAQTWITSANLNIGVVNDNGSPIGSAGLPQGDSRFGDIRISARPLSDEVLAITVPPSFVAGTRGGDVIFNSNYAFGIGASPDYHDIYSVALQEIGHAIGIGNSSDSESPMYESYQGVRAGITDGDVSAVQSLYGVRAADVFDLASNNESFESASLVASVNNLIAMTTPRFSVDGDLTSSSDSDVYKFTVPTNSAGTISVRLTAAGQSLLVPQVSVYTSSGLLKARGCAASPFDNNLNLAISNVNPFETYLIVVEKAPGIDAYSCGRYRVDVNFNPNTPLVIDVAVVGAIDDNHTNDTLNTATALASVLGENGHFVADALFGLADVDVYRIHSPVSALSVSTTTPVTESSTNSASSSTSTTTPNHYTLTVSIRSANPGDGLLPNALVADASGHVFSHRIIRNAQGEQVLQVADVPANLDVFVIAAPDRLGPSFTGSYHLDADFRQPELSLGEQFAGTVSNSAPADFRTLNVLFSSVTQFVVGVQGPASSTGVAGQFIVFNKIGEAVLNLFVKLNRSQSGAVVLLPGEYTLRFRGLTQNAGVELPEMNFSVQYDSLSDPIGAATVDNDTFNDNYDDHDEGDDFYIDLYFDEPDVPDW